MQPIHLSETIRAPLERVFALGLDIPNISKVIPHITKVEMLTDAPVRVGTRWRETRKTPGGKEATVELAVSALDPNRSYTIACEAMGVAFDTRFDFRREGSGTIVDMTMSMAPRGLVARMFIGLMKGPMTKGLRDDLASLKMAAEQ